MRLSSRAAGWRRPRASVLLLLVATVVSLLLGAAPATASTAVSPATDPLPAAPGASTVVGEGAPAAEQVSTPCVEVPVVDDKCEAWAHSDNSFKHSSWGDFVVAAADDRIFYGTNQVRALNTAGKDLWISALDKDLSGPGVSGIVGGLAVSPDDERLYAAVRLWNTERSAVAEDNWVRDAVVAYDASTGAQLWTSGVTYPGEVPSGRADKIAVSQDGGMLFVSRAVHAVIDQSISVAWEVAAYDTGTGTRMWEDRGERPTFQLSASPDGERVYVASSERVARGSGRVYHVYLTVAYDAATGAELWEARYDHEGFDNSLRGISVSPDGSRLFVTGASETVERTMGGGESWVFSTVAYDAATGTQLWVRQWFNPATEPTDLVFAWAGGISVSPAGDRVYVAGTATGSTVPFTKRVLTIVAYDAASGAELWYATYRHPDPGAGPSGLQHVAVSADGAQVYVHSGTINDGQSRDVITVAYDTSTGSQLWAALYGRSTEHNGGYTLNNSGRKVVPSSDGRRVYVLASLTSDFEPDVDNPLGFVGVQVLLAYDNDGAGQPDASNRTAVDALSTAVTDEAVSVTGSATFVDVPKMVGVDQVGDSQSPLPGTDIVAATIGRRPGTDGLTFTLSLADMPPTGGAAGYVYNWPVRVDGGDGDLMLQASVGMIEPCVPQTVTADPVFRLVRGNFEEVSVLKGTFADNKVTFEDVALDKLGAAGGSRLTTAARRVESEVGVAGCATNLGPGDVIKVNPYVVPDKAVQLGLAPVGTAASEVLLTDAATLGEDGTSFSGKLSRPENPGDYIVVVKACYGPENCDLKSTTVTIS